MGMLNELLLSHYNSYLPQKRIGKMERSCHYGKLALYLMMNTFDSQDIVYPLSRYFRQ